MQRLLFDEHGQLIGDMHRISRLVFFTLFAFATPVIAAISPVANSIHAGRTSTALYQWQRIDFPSSELSRRNAPQIKVDIRTRGPSMQGLIRIPGAPASNFDTGKGMTVVDLINVGDEANGYAEIVALEIVFTQAMPGQYYRVFAVGSGKEIEGLR